MVTSKANATWNGKLKDGKGHYEAGSGTFKGDYTAGTRFEGKPGTTPEELLAAAYAACFSMALAANLDKAGTPSTRITSQAVCTMDTVDGKPTVTTIQVEAKGTVSGIDQAAFAKAAEGTKTTCPVARALSGVKFEIKASLEK